MWLCETQSNKNYVALTALTRRICERRRNLRYRGENVVIEESARTNVNNLQFARRNVELSRVAMQTAKIHKNSFFHSRIIARSVQTPPRTRRRLRLHRLFSILKVSRISMELPFPLTLRVAYDMKDEISASRGDRSWILSSDAKKRNSYSVVWQPTLPTLHRGRLLQ